MNFQGLVGRKVRGKRMFCGVSVNEADREAVVVGWDDGALWVVTDDGGELVQMSPYELTVLPEKPVPHEGVRPDGIDLRDVYVDERQPVVREAGARPAEGFEFGEDDSEVPWLLSGPGGFYL